MTLRRWGIGAALIMTMLNVRASDAQVRKTMRLMPGQAAEMGVLVSRDNASALSEQGREAQAGGGWAYQLPAITGAQCRLTCRSTGALTVSVTGPDGKPLAVVREDTPDGFAVSVAAATTHPLGASLTFRFKAGSQAAVLREAEYAVTSPDRNGNGIADALDAALSPAAPPARSQRPSRPLTCFQTGRPYSPDIAVPTDAVLAYSSAAPVLKGWKDAGYTVFTMGGFREGEAYAREHPGEVQTDRDGHQLIIGGNSYYMVPTAERNKRAAAYYLEAVANGAVGVCPEEPELFARAGYSEAFKAEWQAAYGTPWVPPHTDVNARYRAERLKARLTVRQVDTILSAVAQQAPSVRRMLAVHSPITYSHWGIVMPHSELFRLPSVQEIIAQVWTGTARTPNRVAGVRAERTFELAYLEYSSIVCLLRGLGKPVWMLMDPVEDNPDRPMEDYRRNYAETLVASLLFPTADRFEVMPWPDRIYGRVPADYATVVNTVVGALGDCWRFPATVKAGTQGIGMLVSDSMSYQRAEPSPSDFDGVYGLSLPLIGHGIPLDALSLDRCTDSRYLTGTKVLLGSYDFQKPPSAACNTGLADWVRRGGVLMMFGGTDAYDAVSDSWWRAAGDETPLDNLFRQLGLNARRVSPGGIVPVPKPPAQELLRGDAKERNLANRRRYALDLTAIARQNGSVAVRFEDVTPEDGWGPYVTSIELRLRDRLAASFRAGSEMETRFLSVDKGSVVNGSARFADGNAYWEYRFDSLPRDASMTLIVEMGNGFLVRAYAPSEASRVLECTDPAVHPALRRVRTTAGYELTAYGPPDGATVLYRRQPDGAPAIWLVKVDRGALLYCGMPPGYLTATAQTDRLMRDLVRRACAEAGISFEPAKSFIGIRGPYVAVRPLTASETLTGRYVDLLSPELQVVQDPEIPAGQPAFLKDVSGVASPGLMAASGRVEALLEGSTVTAFVVRAPEGPTGAARLAQGSRTFVSAKAWDLWGRPVPVSARQQSGSVLLRYDNRADGVAVKAVWR